MASGQYSFPMTTVDIANQAIQLCGADTVLVTLDDVNKEARLCRNTYDVARRAVLQRHPWKFSIQRVLWDQNTSIVPAFEYTAAYPVPDDYIRLVSINDTYNGPWVREGRYILINGSGQLRVRYVRDEQTVELFDPLFIDALIAELAARIVYPLTQSNDRLEAIVEAAKTALKHAKRADAIEQSVIGIEANTFVDSRITRMFDVPGR